ncbi:epoxide hydrolase N-terminal domain-containing protein [Streptomyces sp. NPDC001970]
MHPARSQGHRHDRSAVARKPNSPHLARRSRTPPGGSPCPKYSRRAPDVQSAAAAERGSGSGSAAGGSICPFRVHFPEKDLVDLRRRITSARWPEQGTAQDQSQGTRLATMKELAR